MSPQTDGLLFKSRHPKDCPSFLSPETDGLLVLLLEAEVSPNARMMGGKEGRGVNVDYTSALMTAMT